MLQNKQSQTADKGWSSSIGVGHRVSNSSSTNILCYEVFQILRIFTDYFGTTFERHKHCFFGYVVLCDWDTWSLILREGHILQMSENKIIRNISNIWRPKFLSNIDNYTTRNFTVHSV
jgi:hypothetical protein